MGAMAWTPRLGVPLGQCSGLGLCAKLLIS